MKYFMDESGNWQELLEERKNLVLTGMVIEDNDTFFQLQKEKKLNNVHMNELSQPEKKEVLEIVNHYLDNDKIKVLSYKIDPKLLLSQTQKHPDEIYMELSAELISELSFMDEEIDIEYDMKFHYSYVKNIISFLESNKVFDEEFRQMKSNCFLNKFKINSNKNRITTALKREKLNEYIPKLNNEKFLNDYLWAEFYLKIRENGVIRERFKEKIRTIIKNRYNLLGIKKDIKLDIKYKGKKQQSNGIGMVDILSNVVFHSYEKDPLIKDILSKLTIKEFK